MIIKPKITGYYAGAVRGEGGDNADYSAMEHNIHTHMTWGREVLRPAVSWMEIYLPHEHEDLFQKPYRMGIIKPRQIMTQCLSILALCDVIFICSDPNKSKGVMAEKLFAERNSIYVLDLSNVLPLEWRQYIDNDNYIQHLKGLAA